MTIPPSHPLRLGTRASPLAIAQARLVRDHLLRAHGWDENTVVICPVVASGDKIIDRALAYVGGKALWTKELDHWLMTGQIDFAVHSMKDVETHRPADLIIAAMLERADVRDRLIGAPSIAELPQRARVGTSAPRRTAQLLRLRPDLKIGLFRGNVQTRLAKLAAGDADATLLAAAGLDRLAMHGVGHAIAIETMLPAPAQGAIGIETLATSTEIRSLLDVVNHLPTFNCVLAERALLAGLAADCRSPVAALATLEGDQIWLRAQILSEDGTREAHGEARFAVGDFGQPLELARQMLASADPALRAIFAG